jgi:hypothetical protein
MEWTWLLSSIYTQKSLYYLSFIVYGFCFYFLIQQYNKYLDGVPPLESQSIDQLRITFVAVLKLYLIALGERPPSQSGTLGKILPTKSTMGQRAGNSSFF